MEMHLNASISAPFSNYNKYSKPEESRIRAREEAGLPEVEMSSSNESNAALPLTPAKIVMNSLRSGKALKLAGKIKNGAWDRSQVARFVDLISKATGDTLDAASILRTYDINGDGMLSQEEQTAMIEALSKSSSGASEQAISSALNQLKDDERAELAMIQNGLKMASSFYESLFWYEEPPEEPILFGA
jgi:hypothetical protein